MNTKLKIMTVKNLKTILTKLKKQGQLTDNTEVWLSSDEEGNSFSPLALDPGCSIGIEDYPGKPSHLTLYPSTHDINVQDFGELP